MAFGISTPKNLKLFNSMIPLDEVTFDLNPKDFSVSKGQTSTARPQTAGNKSGAAPSSPAAGFTSMYRGTAPTQIKFTALLSDHSTGGDAAADAMNGPLPVEVLTGSGIKARCDLLLSWTQPGGGSLLAKAAGMAVSAIASAAGFKFQATARPTLLTLQWGDPTKGFLMQGYLSGVTIDYRRFDSEGNPIRAEVKCTFTEAPNFLLSLTQNPTSGGTSGRRAHVLTEGETLPGLAADTYGRAQAWREIAEANAIDDPLRVRPGQRVALPPPAEVRG